MLVAAGGLGLAYRRFAGGPQPFALELVNVELNDEFLNLEKWETPPAGWRVNRSRGAGSLEITGQPQLGYLKGVAYKDLEAAFDLTLLDRRGAAWAVRVNGEGDYYLFYLSGPDGLHPNRFLATVVRGGKPEPKSEQATNLVAPLDAGQSYHVELTAEGNKLKHKMTNNETGEETELGYFVDPHNTYPEGGFGFRAVNGESFAVDNLWLRPLGMVKP